MKEIPFNDLCVILNQSTPGQQYLSLVNSSTLPLVREVGYEIHHIHPKALGGSNQSDNLVKLTTYQHCLAHVLLAKAYPCLETLNPVILLSGKQVLSLSDLEKVTLAECYGWSKLREKAMVELHRQDFYTEEVRKKMSDSHKGKSTPRKGTHLSRSHRQKLSEIWSGKPKSWLRGKSPSSKGKVWMHKDGRGRRVSPQDLQKFEEEGWIRGCICKCSQKE